MRTSTVGTPGRASPTENLAPRTQSGRPCPTVNGTVCLLPGVTESRHHDASYVTDGPDRRKASLAISYKIQPTLRKCATLTQQVQDRPILLDDHEPPEYRHSQTPKRADPAQHLPRSGHRSAGAHSRSQNRVVLRIYHIEAEDEHPKQTHSHQRQPAPNPPTHRSPNPPIPARHRSVPPAPPRSARSTATPATPGSEARNAGDHPSCSSRPRSTPTPPPGTARPRLRACSPASGEPA